MKKRTFYQLLSAALGIVTCVSLCMTDRTVKQMAALKEREAAAVMKTIDRAMKEVSYDLSVIYWSPDPGNYRDSVRNIESVCGRIEGAIGIFGPENGEIYLDYCRSLCEYIRSLPSDTNDIIRQDCLALRDMNDRIRDGDTGLIPLFVEKADSLSYSESRYLSSSSGVCAVNSAPLPISSCSSR